MSTIVRQAESSDAESLAALYRELVPGNERIAVSAVRLAQVRDDATNFVFVVETDGQVRGTVTLTLCLDVMFGDRPYGLIENFVISHSHRGLGLGRRLIHHVEQVCVAANCTKLMLLSAHRRVEAHHFFEQMGFDGTVSRAFKRYLNSSRES